MRSPASSQDPSVQDRGDRRALRQRPGSLAQNRPLFCIDPPQIAQGSTAPLSPMAEHTASGVVLLWRLWCRAVPTSTPALCCVHPEQHPGGRGDWGRAQPRPSAHVCLPFMLETCNVGPATARGAVSPPVSVSLTHRAHTRTRSHSHAEADPVASSAFHATATQAPAGLGSGAHLPSRSSDPLSLCECVSDNSLWR